MERTQSTVPEQLKPALEQNLARLQLAVQKCTNSEQVALDSALPIIALGTDYVCLELERHPELLADLIRSNALETPARQQEIEQRVHAALAAVETEEALLKSLRDLRRGQMIRVIWRDLTRAADLAETTHALSWFADAIVNATLHWLYPRAVKRWGTPMGVDADGVEHEQQMVVLGMGKLGAYELNLSSDIDLIFAYPQNGETRGGPKTLSNQEFFTRLGRQLVQALDSVTADGFVFRVDMRLRPFGSVGPLACSFSALETYYQDQGRDWERYALIKARVIAGDKRAGQELQELLRPFVYRRYIDYSAFESLRKMKALISREVKLKHRDNDVKLGAGGIREIEFVVQAFQLIRGGRDVRLQQRELASVLPLLTECMHLPQQTVDELWAAYQFLRNTEHALQALADRQTQTLPQEPLGQARLAWVMGFANWQSFWETLQAHRQHVGTHFAEVVAFDDKPLSAEDDSQLSWEAVWDAQLEASEAIPYLEELGFKEPQRALELLSALQQLRTVQQLQAVGLERLTAVMPQLLERVGKTENPEQTLERVLTLIQAVLRRSAYLVLLHENPEALAQLVRLCAASHWFAEHISRYPGVLDELIDPQALYAPMTRASLADELRQLLLRIPEQDVEQMMEALRYFKHAHVLRVAASDITGALPLMKVSDRLTWLAEVLLDAVLEIAWADLTAKYGVPERTPGEPCDPGFIIVGYGKLGGIELSYGSDLDLVFIHDADEQLATKGGNRELANPVFFTRLGQRIIHLLNTFTPSGQLYDVDMRLRPSGNSGLLVTSLKAFEHYQRKDAWTWEHQALVRARAISGDTRLMRDFEAIRKAVICQPRERKALRQEVAAMRERMRLQLGTPKGSELFDLKQDRGGMVDIEFMVQYLALAYAHDHADIVQWSDNMRIIDALEAHNLLWDGQADSLRDSYKTYRAYGHRQTLQNRANRVEASRFREQREQVSDIWQSLMEE